MATRTNRRHGGEAAAEHRALVRGATAASPRYSVVFDARTVFDFLVSMSLGGEETVDISVEDQAWLRDTRASLPADVRAGMFVGTEEHGGMGVDVAALAIGRPEIREAADLVAAVERTPAREIAAALLWPHDSDVPLAGESVRRALEGDREAIAAIDAYLEAQVDEKWCGAVRSVVVDPIGAAERLHLALRAWLEPFRAIERRVGSALERDVAARRADLDLPPGELVEKTTGGIRLLAEPGLRRVILAPSYFARPYNWLAAGEGWRLFCYPLADAALDQQEASAPPASALRLYRALGDASRLRILRLLANRDMYLTEIAQQLDLSKPTVKHHLAELRAAGLVTVTDQGVLTWYTLRRDRLDETGVELRRYLS